MAKVDVLARVKQDLALGHTYTATRRLRTLIAVDPGDLDLREMLAGVYRQTGNLVEAGRWAYLSDHLRPAEAEAFERANPSPWLRLRMLRYSGELDQLSPAARERLVALGEEAERVGPPPIWGGPPLATPQPQRGSIFPCLFVVVALTVFTALMAVGVYRVIEWFVNF